MLKYHKNICKSTKSL